MTTLIAMTRREIIEHRAGLIYTPAILMGLMLVLTVGSMTFGIGEIGLGQDEGRHVTSFGMLLEELADAESSVRAGLVITFLSLMSLPAILALPFVIFFIALGSLYEERRDRSFLFWKSMPVSDLEEVLVKLGAGLVLAPAFFLVVGIVVQLATMLFISLIGGLQGGPVTVVWQIVPLVLHWIHGAFVLLVWAGWALPVFAWVQLCGAYAPRVPFMYAVVPPIALIVLERVFLHSGHFAQWLGTHLGAVPLVRAIADEERFEAAARAGDEEGFELIMTELAKADFGAVFESFAYADFWVGLAIAAGLITGSVWLRRHNL